MVRSYRKFEPTHTFAAITTPTSNTLWTSTTNTRSTSAGLAYTSANQSVLCWDIKTSTLVSTWSDSSNTTNAVVTSLTQCAAQPDIFAAGYSDGSIRVWDALSAQVIVSFDGHRSAVTQLCFDGEGERLVSGSRDTDIIVWDLVGEKAEARLRGHKAEVTGLSFLGQESNHGRWLVSTSKDALIKIWDLEGRFCVETHVAQESGECWALGVSPDGDGCITGGSEGELKVWSVDTDALARDNLTSGDAETNGQKKGSILTSRGILRRQGNKDRTIGISFHPRLDYIAIHGADKAVEVWRIRSEEELHKHMQRKRRRRREKAAAVGEADFQDVQESPDVTDVFVPHLIVRTGGKVRSAAWMQSPKSSTSKNKSLQLLVTTTNNLLETYTVSATPSSTGKSKDEAAPDYNRALSLDIPGHRTDVRTLSLSSDDRMLASASAGQLKIWNMRTRSCIRSMECGTALCSAFLPGDRIVLVGTKEGMLEMWDISTSSLIESIHAHGDPNAAGSAQQAAIWTMAVHPDGKSAVTGGADKVVKFWKFDIVDEEIPGTRRTTQRLKLAPTRQLKLADDVLSLSFSPDEKYLAVSTLSNIVQIFFVDSLKLFLQLYGHKLPVLDISISSDSKLIATCSADKNIRIWGLDFGDCHKAFFAHDDSVMSVNFVPHPVESDEKYILFSASKDGVVKTWDTQKFEQVQRLEGHRGEVWAMAIGRTGELCVTAGHDKALRCWEVGDDLVFLEEERERELELMYESNLAQNLERDARDEDAMMGDDEDGAVAANVGKQTVSTLTHGEKIMEALEIGITDLEVMKAYEIEKERNPNMAQPQRNPLFIALGNISAEQHILNTLRAIPMSSLNDALLVLPFSSLTQLFTFLAIFMEKRMQPELAWRVTYFLLQVHMKQIVASGGQLKQLLERILEGYEAWVDSEKDVLGFNLAGLEVVGREVREGEGVRYLDDVGDAEEMVGRGGRKRAFASLA